ncbi:MAG: helix-turn-helix domain-containing protein [Geobacteraceae bacterium]
MTAEELKTARAKLGLNMTEMAQVLKTPYRTYQDWESGERRVPGICDCAVELLLAKDRWVMERIKTKLETINLTGGCA